MSVGGGGSLLINYYKTIIVCRNLLFKICLFYSNIECSRREESHDFVCIGFSFKSRYKTKKDKLENFDINRQTILVIQYPNHCLRTHSKLHISTNNQQLTPFFHHF